MSSPSLSSPRERLLPLLQGLKVTSSGWTARCPGHDDQHASLSLCEGDDGRLLVKCHAGCSLTKLMAAVGLTVADLFPRPLLGTVRRLVATYDYCDEGGQLLYQVVRYAPKTFRQRRPNGRGGWVWKLDDTRRVLYRLPELLAAPPQEPVFVVEGEKDARRLTNLGLVATTNVGGAGKWRPEYGAALRGRSVVVVPDNDEPGRAHAQQVIDLTPVADLRVLELPGLPPKGDVSDWLDAGGEAATLRRLAAAAPLGVDWSRNAPTDGPPGSLSPPAATDDGLLLALAAVPSRPVTWLWPDRLGLGKVAILDGDPGLGKSLLTLDLAARVTRGRPFPDGSPSPLGDVLIVNCEDGVADTIRPRLEALNADVNRVSLLRGRPAAAGEQPLTFPRDLDRLLRAVRRTRAVLVIIDPLMAFLDETIATGNDQSVRLALAPLAAVADETSCAVLLVRHLNKTGGGKAIYRGGGSIGIVGACRSAWLVARHPTEPRRRVLAQVKNNLAPPQPSLAYEVFADVEGQPRLNWCGTVDLSADELMAGSPVGEPPARDGASALLRELLRDGPRPVEELVALAARHGHSRATLYRARDEVGIVARIETTAEGVRAVWRLRDPAVATTAAVPATPAVAAQPSLPGLSIPAGEGHPRSLADGPYYREP